ncbi:putative Ig domain-containing protein [Corynebacterium resistens]
MQGEDYNADRSARMGAAAVRPGLAHARHAVLGFAMSAVITGGVALAPALMPTTIAQETEVGQGETANAGAGQKAPAVAITVLEGRKIRPVTISLSGFGAGATARLDGLPPGMNYTPAPVLPGQNTSAAKLTGVPSKVGFFTVTATAVDNNGVEILDSYGRPIAERFTIQVIPVELSLQAKPASQTVTVGSPIANACLETGAGYSAKDVTFDPKSLPNGVTYDSTSGCLTGTPTEAGRYEVVFRLADEPSKKSVSTTVVFEVEAEKVTSVPTEPTTTEPTEAEPTPAEPTAAEPTTAEPTPAEPTTTKPTNTEPTAETPSTPTEPAELPTPSPNNGPDDSVVPATTGAGNPPTEVEKTDVPPVIPIDAREEPSPDRDPILGEVSREDSPVTGEGTENIPNRSEQAPQQPNGRQQAPVRGQGTESQRSLAPSEPRIQIQAEGVIGSDENELLGRLSRSAPGAREPQNAEQNRKPSDGISRPFGDFSRGRSSNGSGAKSNKGNEPHRSNEASGYLGASAGSRGPLHLEEKGGMVAMAATVTVTLVGGGVLLNLRRRL